MTPICTFVPRSEILETTGSPFLPWKVNANLTAPDGTLHIHLDVSWVSCHHSLIMAESLNKGILPEIIPTGQDDCKQQWPHEDHWEMPNLLIGYDDPQYHNHDLDEDVNKEWFQGRDGWD